jgi:iron complex transport system substrate-binding protein
VKKRLAALVAASCALGLAIASGASGAAPCNRIVSLAPSLTETLFAEGLGPKVVGVTRYCRYPPEARALPKIGGFLDPSLEFIVGLKPDLIMTLAEQSDVRELLKKAGFEVMTFEHRHVNGILDSIDAIGKRCGQEAQARELAGRLRARIAAVQERVKDLPRVRTMVAIGGDTEDGLLRSVFIAGNDGYYDDLLRLAGGVNVDATGTVSVPSLSAEGVISADPQVIIQIMTSPSGIAFDTAKVLAAWKAVPELRAVREDKVFVLTEDYASLPGPRFADLLERFAAMLHPVRQ